MVKIKLKKWLSEDIFEELIGKHYSTSLATNDFVEFDFTNTEWCDLLSLSLLSLWILELSERNIPIRVLAPEDRNVTEFLRNYNFLMLLHRQNVEHNFSFDITNVRARTNQTTNVVSIPLTFLDREKLSSLLADLQSPRRLDVVLREMAHSDVVKSGAIRDVVLAEIGSNFFDHAGGRFAHILLTAYRSVPLEFRSRRVERQVRVAPQAQKEFFKVLNGEPYLVFTLSDMGPGIPATIAHAHTSIYKGTGNPAPEPSELLRFAFEYNSTSRSLSERIGSIERFLLDQTTSEKVAPPPTGLYQLRTVMREFRGMLVVKTRGAWLVEDFLSGQETMCGARDTSSSTFGGTQYKLLFPFNIARTKKVFSNQFSGDGRLACLQLTPPGELPRPSDEAAIHQVFQQMYQTIELRVVAARKRKEALLIDAKGMEVLPSKYIFYLLVKLMEQEPPHQYTIIVNAPPSIPEIRPTISTTTHPLLVFDENWVPRAVGLSEQDQEYFNELLTGEPIVRADVKEFARRVPHWFKYERLERGAIERYVLHLSEVQLKESLRSAYGTQLKDALLEERNCFFFPNKKVLLPSRQYCHGYFDISKFLEDVRLKYILKSWVAYSCEKRAPDFVVTVGNNAHEIASSVGDVSRRSIEILNIATPIRPSKLFEVSRVVAESRIVIVTDVIGTSQSLRSVIRSLQRAEIVSTLAVVNATEHGENAVMFDGKTYIIEAVVSHRLSFAQSLPNDWNYDDVVQVDPETHALIPKHVRDAEGSTTANLWDLGGALEEPTAEPVSLMMSNRFLEEAILPTSAMLEGHFASDSAHMVHLFNIPKLLMALGDEISQRIYKDADTYLMNANTQLGVSHIAYPEYNVGLEDLAMRLSASFSGSLPIALSRHVLGEQLAEAVTLGMVVIFLDDAMYSGNTVLEMLDLGEAAQVKHILVYTVVRRGHQKITNRVRKIGRYGRSIVAIREISAVELPVYKPSDCPVCAQRKTIQWIQESLDESSPLHSEAQSDLNMSAPVLPQVACKEDARILLDDPTRISDRVRLRWMLGCAYDSHKFRNQLAEIVRAYKVNETLVLDLFITLAHERGSLLQNSDARTRVFYPSFVQAIVPAAMYFMDQLGALNPDEAEGAIAILAAFDPHEFLQRLPTFLDRHRDNMRLSWLLIRECHLTPEVSDWPERVLLALSEARQIGLRAGSHPVDDVIPIWKKIKELSERRDGVGALDTFQRLTGRKVHDLTKFVDKVANDIESENDSLASDWRTVGEALTVYISDLLRFRRSLAECNGTTALWERIQEFEVNFNSVVSVIHHVFKVQKCDSETKVALLERLRRMHDLIDSRDGIRALLEEFRTNIIDPLRQALSQFDNFSECTTLDITEERAPLVFGHSFGIYTVLINLIDNASKAGALRLHIHIHVENEQTVVLHVLDDGHGVGSEISEHHGLEIVHSTIEAYAGSFELRAVCGEDSPAYGMYSTLAKIQLPFVPESRPIGDKVP